MIIPPSHHGGGNVRKKPWYDPEQQTCLSGGKTHTVFVPLGKNRYLAKVPSVIPVSESCAKLSSGRFDALEFLLYPGEKSCVYRYYEDDGQTSLDKNAYAETVVILSAAQVSVTVKKGLELMCGKKVRLVLPEGFRFACGKQELSVELVEGTAVYCFSGEYCQAGNMDTRIQPTETVAFHRSGNLAWEEFLRVFRIHRCEQQPSAECVWFLRLRHQRVDGSS